MEQLLNHMRRQAEMVQWNTARVRVGTVAGYDPDNYSCKVILQPDGTLTGWLPIVSPWVGNGWGMFAPPSEGDMVEVQFQEDSKEAGFVCQRFFNDVERPVTVFPGEFWLFHKTGAYIKLKNNGRIIINGQTEIDATSPTITITATTAVNVTAPAINLGASGQTLHALVTDALQALYNTHTHSDPQGGTTGVPNQLITGSHLTTTIQGG